MRFRILALAVLAVLIVGAEARAQIQGGSITGAIKDEQGGVLPGVLVTVQGVDATQTFTTESSGEYRFLNLAPGLLQSDRGPVGVHDGDPRERHRGRRPQRRAAGGPEDRGGR